MRVATYCRGAQSLTYWGKNNKITRDSCQSEAYAKLIVMEQSLKHRVRQKLTIER